MTCRSHEMAPKIGPMAKDICHIDLWTRKLTSPRLAHHYHPLLIPRIIWLIFKYIGTYSAALFDVSSAQNWGSISFDFSQGMPLREVPPSDLTNLASVSYGFQSSGHRSQPTTKNSKRYDKYGITVRRWQAGFIHKYKVYHTGHQFQMVTAHDRCLVHFIIKNVRLYQLILSKISLSTNCWS